MEVDLLEGSWGEVVMMVGRGCGELSLVGAPREAGLLHTLQDSGKVVEVEVVEMVVEEMDSH